MIGYLDQEIASGAGPLVARVQQGMGPTVVLQHGLCGDAAQPAEVFPANQGFRHAILNCRGHGGSPLGPVDQVSIATFAEDVAALIRQVAPVAVGGISMGAAISLRLAVHQPTLVPALILSRPAWATDAAPANMAPNAEVGRALPAGLAAFDTSATARHLAKVAPDNLASLRSFFTRAPLAETATLLTHISADGPGVTEADLSRLSVPTLILATDEDFVHPVAHAEHLARLIPGATLIKVPPKGRDRAAHVAAMQSAILNFLKGLPHAPSRR